MTATDIILLEETSCVSSLPGHQAGSAPRWSPSCSDTTTKCLASLALTPPPRPSPPLAAKCGAVDVTDLAVLFAAAKECDGVIHLAFRHDVAFSGDFETAVASDHAAIEAIGDALAGTDKPLAIASGLAGLRSGEIATEDDRPQPTPGPGGRIINERAALALAERGVRSMSVRFAPTVHGVGDHGFIALIVTADREHGGAAYVGDGDNRWPAVHVTDAARLVRLGIEHAPAGSVLHATGEGGIPFRHIAEAIGRRLQLPINLAGRRTGRSAFRIPRRIRHP